MSRAFDRFKASAFLVLVGGYLIFNYPFMQFVLGELFLIVILLSTNVPRVLSRMNATVFLFPFMIWWSWGFGRLIFDTMGQGFWAFRDATQLIDSLFLVVGFTLAGEPRTVARLAYWLRPIVIICCIYAMLFGYADDITAISPTLPGASGQAIAIFGAYAIPSTMLLLGAVFCVIQPARSPAIRMRYLLVAGFLVAYALVVIQARTTYLQLLGVAGLLLILRPRALSGLGLGIPIFFSILIVISALNIRISGRLTSDLSLSFFWEHIQSIVGISEKAQGGVASAADGVSLRLGWWNRLYDQLTADGVTLITGLGYGIPLTNFSDTLGVTTREPHNSVISVTARLGLIGIFSWIWMQVELFRAGFRAYFDCRRTGRSEAANFILLCVAFAVLTLASCFGEDAMEKPYNAIPYYAFWGFVLRIGYRLRAKAARGHFAYRAPQAAGASRPSTS
jgi:hypothetical protein